MRRRLLNILTALSLLLCVAVAALWVRSYWRVHGVAFEGAAGTRGAVSRGGALYFIREPPGVGVPPAGWVWLSGPVAGAPTMPAGVTGPLGFGDFEPAGAMGPRIVAVPWWCVAVLGLALAGWRVGQPRRGRDRAAGVCSHCGYDLRATPDRCPECGTEAA